MNRHQRFYAQLFPKRAPNWILKALMPHEFKHLPDVKRKCDYCEGHRKKDEEVEWHSRVTLRRLPSGLFKCGKHGTAAERQIRGFAKAAGVQIVEDEDESPVTDDGSDS